MDKSTHQITILIADDHAIVREGLAVILGLHPDFTVIGEAEDGKVAVEMARIRQPDVVLMDLMMPVVDGAEATEQIKAACPQTKILILTSYGDSFSLNRALENGANGALSKTLPKEQLFSAIHDVTQGNRIISADIQQTLREREALPDLTQRQLDILQSLSRGLTNRDIAQQFGLSMAGIKFHLLAIFRKLNVANRSEAVSLALRKHLVKGT